MKKPLPPIGFLSYVRADDAHDRGRITEFKEALSGELRMVLGADFPIFQDRDDILWGQNWRERLDGAVDGATVLFPVVTPAYFQSQPCRDELTRFLDRERALGRNDLVFPLYYANCKLLDDPALTQTDALAQAVADHNWVDWRELRFESMTSATVRRAINAMAEQVAETLHRGDAPAKPAAKKAAARKPAVAAAAETGDGDDGARTPTAKTEVPTHVVDGWNRGDFTTISAAIAAARPGDRILVRPGHYEEALVLDKALEIVGDGSRDDIVVQIKDAYVIDFRASMGRVAGLTLRQGGGDYHCVNIGQGRLDLEDCAITSQGLSCVKVHGGADPRIRRCRVHDGAQSGLFFLNGARGTVEDNDITGNALSGIEIKDGADPVVRGNRIHEGKSAGVYVHGDGRGTVEDNDIVGNALAGIVIKDAAAPVVRGNRIHDNKQAGILVHGDGRCTVEDNDIVGNAYAGIEIKTGGAPTVRGNRIGGNGYWAIRVYDNGGGTFTDNDLRGNKRGAWDIAEDCEANVTRADNVED